MAEIVMGVATSHSPHLSADPGLWHERAEQDHTNPLLFDRDGVLRPYEEVLAGAGDRYAGRAGQAQWDDESARAQAALDHLKAAIAQARPDVVIIVGDDQRELLSDANQPSLAIAGAPVLKMGIDDPTKMFHDSAFHKAAVKAYWQDAEHAFKGHAGLAADLTRRLNDAGVDVGWMGGDSGYGHAFGFPIQRLLLPDPPPVIPFLVNTFWDPNQPTPKRCFEVGRALRAAIDATDIPGRVVLLASGGLSHFVVDEDLDLNVMKALANEDWDYLTSIPPELLKGGTSEIRNWILVAAAVDGMKVNWSEFVAAIRTDAGTGCGLGFMTWE